ncbi:RNA polymerase sigma factor [Blautia sp.]|uniref:RNA polymerase sigma factor n=1 Tax=Blautia sp. TaxID=1955243 RepID=UPI003AB77FC8
MEDTDIIELFLNRSEEEATMEDTDIIELFLNRSEEAIRQTDIKYSKLCFGIAWNILLNKEDSEECVNDTWLITWNEIPPKIPKILSAFVGKITRNQAIDCLRRKNAFKRVDTHMADINGELERLEETVQYSLEHNIKRQEILDILDEFLKGLKEEDRDIFVRRYWYMDDIKEISRRHSVSESKVKSSLFRSRKKLWKKAGDLL